ncbi:hypothetical protein CPB84DRAFT_1549706 [Gymnopilus junonius]|uniref:Uncharacterized protein n=1 Tax=Gymnopilus junonius TaxID=109634 RepID=A0A9P5N810_GYMJU|nr:hypothetical protein CPB84DRAFT_1549706 [Gymnopilus junonius]
MDDSDDYIVDDIVFDNQTLAALDLQEKKYILRSSVPTTSEGPVNKRLKTSTGQWKPGIGVNLEPADSYEDLPEISLRVDGSYDIGNPIQPAKTSVSGFGSRYKQPRRSVENHALSQNVPQTHASGSRDSYPLKASSNNKEDRHLPMPQARVQQHPAGTKQSSPQISTGLQMLELQKRLEEMRDENMKVQSALKDAVDAKLAKEGEVSILRKNIEKLKITQPSYLD